jgi:hypothetical protein
VVDTYFEQVLLPVLPAGSVIVLDNARPSIPDDAQAGGGRRLSPFVFTLLLTRPQSHRTSLGRVQNPPA